MLTIIYMRPRNDDAMPHSYQSTSATLRCLLGLLKFGKTADIIEVVTYKGELTKEEKQELVSRLNQYAPIFVELDENIPTAE